MAHDRTNPKTCVRTYNGLEIQIIDLKKANFDERGRCTIDLQNDFAPQDITGPGKPLAQSGSWEWHYCAHYFFSRWFRRPARVWSGRTPR